MLSWMKLVAAQRNSTQPSVCTEFWESLYFSEGFLETTIGKFVAAEIL